MPIFHKNTSLLLSEIPNISRAISNGWFLRPIKKGFFNNIDNQKGTLLTDKNHILTCVEDLDKFPEGTTELALIPDFYLNFICLDFDSLSQDLNSSIFAVLKSFYREDELFRRIGNPLKLGQFWFNYDHSFDIPSQPPKLDLIVKGKRCNALGRYKDTFNSYIWPNRNLWENTPAEMPILLEECLLKIIDLYELEYGFREPIYQKSGARHDFLRNSVYAQIFKGVPPHEIYQEILETPEFKSLSSDGSRRSFFTAKKEIIDMFPNAVKKFLEKGDFPVFYQKESPHHDFLNNPLKDHPKVEVGSLLDILYRATLRNQHTNAGQMAFFTALSAVSWLLSYSIVYGKTRSNLMVLYVALSGSGKTTSSQLLQSLKNIIPPLNKSWKNSNIESKAAFTQSFASSPINFYFLDEYTKILKGKNKSNSATSELSELFCQYYSDFCDDNLQHIQLKNESYGVCYGPRFSSLMFTTPEFKNEFYKKDFMAGMGRRTFMVVDDNLYLNKPTTNENKEFFNQEEIKFIQNFVSKWVFEKEDNFDDFSSPEKINFSHEIFDKVDISQIKIEKGFNKKTNSYFYYDFVLKPKVRHNIIESSEAQFYLNNDHTKKSNELKIKAHKSGDTTQGIIVNSFSEFTKKLSMIYALAGRKEPSLEVRMDAITWAEDMFYFYMVESLSQDLEPIFDSDETSNKISLLAEKVIQKLISSKTQLFKISDNLIKNIFQKNNKIFRSQVISYLLANKKIELLNNKTSKKSMIYKLVEENKNGEIDENGDTIQAST